MTTNGKYRLESLNVTKPVSVEDLEYGLSVLARIIDTQGSAVWPLFERLERDLETMQSRRRRIEVHLQPKTDFS